MAKVGRAARNSSLMRVETISTAGTTSAPSKIIRDAETGEVYFIDNSSGIIVVQLPAPRAGMYFKFIISSAGNNSANSFAVITDVVGTDVYGGILHNGAISEVQGVSTVEFDASEGASTAGDFLELISDGTSWYCWGNVDTTAGLAFAAGHALA